MSVTLKMANVWRVLRDVNLEAIRTNADARFVLPLIADELDDAEGVRTLLGAAGGGQAHPWVVTVRAADGLRSLPVRPVLGVLIARGPDLSPDLAAARAALARDGIGVVTALVGGDARRPAPAPDEAARIAAPSVDSRLIRDLAGVLVKAAGPDGRLPLARQLPALREPVLAALIEETAQANASYAMATGIAEAVPVLTAPMNLGDMVVLTKNQLVMSYRLALACGMDGDPKRLIPEILGVLGGGLVFRQLARQLVGLIPVIGLVPKVAIAYGGTYAIGRAVAAWALEGREVSSDALQRFSREGLERGRDLARGLVQSARKAGGRSRWDIFRRQVPAARQARQ